MQKQTCVSRSAESPLFKDVTDSSALAGPKRGGEIVRSALDWYRSNVIGLVKNDRAGADNGRRGIQPSVTQGGGQIHCEYVVFMKKPAARGGGPGKYAPPLRRAEDHAQILTVANQSRSASSLVAYGLIVGRPTTRSTNS